MEVGFSLTKVKEKSSEDNEWKLNVRDTLQQTQCFFSMKCKTLEQQEIGRFIALNLLVFMETIIYKSGKNYTNFFNLTSVSKLKVGYTQGKGCFSLFQNLEITPVLQEEVALELKKFWRWSFVEIGKNPASFFGHNKQCSSKPISLAAGSKEVANFYATNGFCRPWNQYGSIFPSNFTKIDWICHKQSLSQASTEAFVRGTLEKPLEKTLSIKTSTNCQTETRQKMMLKGKWSKFFTRFKNFTWCLPAEALHI